MKLAKPWQLLLTLTLTLAMAGCGFTGEPDPGGLASVGSDQDGEAGGGGLGGDFAGEFWRQGAPRQEIFILLDIVRELGA